MLFKLNVASSGEPALELCFSVKVLIAPHGSSNGPQAQHYRAHWAATESANTRSVPIQYDMQRLSYINSSSVLFFANLWRLKVSKNMNVDRKYGS